MPRVHLHPAAVPPATLAALHAAQAGVAAAPNFWVPRAAIEAGAAAARCAPELAVSQLFERVMRGRLPADWAGAEYWCQVRFSSCRAWGWLDCSRAWLHAAAFSTLSTC